MSSKKKQKIELPPQQKPGLVTPLNAALAFAVVAGVCALAVWLLRISAS